MSDYIPSDRPLASADALPGEQPTEELERMLAETEQCLSEIRAELDRREHAAQRVEIDNLETHLADARVTWRDVKNFFDIVLQELKR